MRSPSGTRSSRAPPTSSLPCARRPSAATTTRTAWCRSRPRRRTRCDAPTRCWSAARTSPSGVDTQVHCHLLETKIQTVIANERYGTTMVKHLDAIGALSNRLSCAHTIWIDDDDIALMAERGAMVVHNPGSNIRGGSGIAPIAKMIRAGVTIALGADGNPSGGQSGAAACDGPGDNHRPSPRRQVQRVGQHRGRHGHGDDGRRQGHGP